MMLRQSTAVAIDGRALLLEGAPGVGKSSIALALIDRGATLVGDDGIAIEDRGGRLWAAPAPATRGLIELRGIGIVRQSVTSAPVALVLMVGEEGPRHVEVAPRCDIAGFAIPRLSFDPTGPAAAIRAEYALAIHGLPRDEAR